MARKLAGKRREDQRAMARTWGRVIKREALGIAKELIEDPLYLEMMRTRLRKGTLHPQLQVMLWGYGYGKPKELVELKRHSTVRIIHEYLDPSPAPIEGEVVTPDPVAAHLQLTETADVGE